MCMQYNQDMKFSELCAYFERIEATTKRLEKTEILAELLKKVEPGEVRVVVNLALGQLAAPYERIEFNLAEKMLIRAIAQSGGKKAEEIEAEMKRVGDIGEVGLRSQADGVGAGLTISAVYAKLVEIAREQGTGSQERKVRGVVGLLGQCSRVEAKYVVRVVNESLRLGFSESTMLDVFSYVAAQSKAYSLRLEKGYQMRPDLARLGEEVITRGVEETIASARVELGVPVIPALAQRLESVEEMIKKMGRVYVEPKLDGTRVQIHYAAHVRDQESGAEKTQQSMFEEEEKPSVWVKTFTRNLDENTAQFPELLQIKNEIKAEEVILDGEAVGYDPKTGELLPFQMTITRKRKHGVASAQESVPLRFYIFDVLYVDGETLIETPLDLRRARLAKLIPGEGVLRVNEAIETESPAKIREYHAEQLAKGYEGVLVKKREGGYEPGRAGFNWVKLKEVETAEGKLSDTIDAVVLGYYNGKGKRSGFGIGAFLVGIRDQERIVTIAKIGTGLSDEQFRELYQRAQAVKLSAPRPEYEVDKMHYPDVWLAPEIVVEIAADEITVSPSHTAGYALRFPRLVKFREDKSAREITTLSELKAIGRLA